MINRRNLFKTAAILSFGAAFVPISLDPNDSKNTKLKRLCKYSTEKFDRMVVDIYSDVYTFFRESPKLELSFLISVKGKSIKDVWLLDENTNKLKRVKRISVERYILAPTFNSSYILRYKLV